MSAILSSHIASIVAGTGLSNKINLSGKSIKSITLPSDVKSITKVKFLVANDVDGTFSYVVAKGGSADYEITITGLENKTITVDQEALKNLGAVQLKVLTTASATFDIIINSVDL